MSGQWAHHDREWRDPAQISGYWQSAGSTDPRLLRYTAFGAWWEILEEARVTLLVTREYEHLLIGLHARSRPTVSFMPLPHPSGLVVDHDQGVVHVATTRNPNQVHTLAPVMGVQCRGDADVRLRGRLDGLPLLPVHSRFFPGSLYLHDLALIGGVLHANAVGHNAVVRIHDDGMYEPVWWPESIDRPGDRPAFSANYLQLNSIAAGPDLASSFFSASTAAPSTRRPGQHNFPVDKQGVVFSGASRQPVMFGLTRPHSARLFQGRVWLDNSGYGEFGREQGQQFEPVARLPGWTRGLCFVGKIAIVGTSRVLPGFRHYAPGLDLDKSVCGLHAVDTVSGAVLGSLIWPEGNQIFAIDTAPLELTTGFPSQAGARRRLAAEKHLFYTFKTARSPAPGGGE